MLRKKADIIYALVISNSEMLDILQFGAQNLNEKLMFLPFASGRILQKERNKSLPSRITDIVVNRVYILVPHCSKNLHTNTARRRGH